MLQSYLPVCVCVGILADEMGSTCFFLYRSTRVHVHTCICMWIGMGKTLQTIALLSSRPLPKPTLIVTPVIALLQVYSPWLVNSRTCDAWTWCSGASRLSCTQSLDQCSFTSSTAQQETPSRHRQRLARTKSSLQATPSLRFVDYTTVSAISYLIG